MPSISQSVARCIAIFELFAERQMALTAADIAEHLGAPRSSVAALLKELVDLRMVSLNRRTLSYLPTVGFAKLSEWLTDPDQFPPSVGEVIQVLQQECGETVTVTWPLDSEMEVIRVEKSRYPISFVAEMGQRISLWGSAVGTAYLSTLSNAQITARWEKDRRRITDIPGIEDILSRVSQTREDEVSVVHSGVFAGASAVAKVARHEHKGRPLVISIAGPENRVREHEQQYRSLIAEVMERHRV